MAYKRARSGKRKRKPKGRYFIYTVRDLAVLFNVSVFTIRRWDKKGLLNLSSLADIIQKYNNPQELDRRMIQVERSLLGEKSDTGDINLND